MTKWQSDQMTRWQDDKKLRRRLTVWYIYFVDKRHGCFAGAQADPQAELWAGAQAAVPAEAGHGAGHPVQPGDDQWS